MTDVSRRHLIAGLLASTGLAAGAGAARLLALAQAPPGAKPYRIDIHHHFAPPAWVTAVKGRPLLQPANTTWTPAKSIEDMDRGGVAASIVSITNPGLWFGDAPMTKQLARACNEYGAKLVQDHPTRFGLFAAMPLAGRRRDARRDRVRLRHAEGGRRRALHQLRRHVAGQREVSTGDGGTEPPQGGRSRASDRRQLLPQPRLRARRCAGSMEYGTDTTRAIMGVAFSGDAARFPDIRFIWSHAGGTVPFLAGRIEGASNNAKDRLPNGFIAEIRKFYYDLAGASNRGAVASLLELVKPSQVLFGTDFPPGGTSAEYVKALSELKMFSPADLRAIDRDNALATLATTQNVNTTHRGTETPRTVFKRVLRPRRLSVSCSVVVRWRLLQLRVRHEVVLDPDLGLRPLQILLDHHA